MIVLPIHKQRGQAQERFLGQPQDAMVDEDEDDTPAEWSLLELNGEILTPKQEPNGDCMELGKLKFDKNDGTPIITVAAHEIKGKVQPLKQNFVVLKPIDASSSLKRKDGFNGSHSDSKRHKVDGNDTDVDMTSESVLEGSSAVHGGYEVAGVVTSKVLFDRYPKSIMR